MLRSTARLSAHLKTDVVIIGSGVIGCATAMELARKGVKTINVDKMPAAGMGSTSYSSAISRMHYSVLDGVKMSWEGYKMYENWADYIGVKDERGMPTMRKTGSLIFRGPLSENFVSKVVAHFDTLKIPYENWSMETAKTRLGGWDLTAFGPPKRIDDDNFGTPSDTMKFSGAFFYKDAGYMSDPQLLTHNMYTAAIGSGNGSFVFGRNVVEISKKGDEVTGVVLDNGDVIHSRSVVNAAGPFSSTITGLAFKNSPVANDMNVSTRPWRAEVAYVEAPEVDLLPLTSDADVGVYFRPEIGGRLVIGSVEPACDEPEFLDDPHQLSDGMTELWNNLVYRAALRLPGIKIPNTAQGIVSMYDVTEDWMPIYDKSILKNYFMAIGTSGNQFKNGGVAGRLMAELIVREWNGVDHDKDPLQLNLPLTGNIMNVGVYSRTRPVNKDSSASVMA